MPDYFVSKSFVPAAPEAEIPIRSAIAALRDENSRLERSLPRPEPVPAYEPPPPRAAQEHGAKENER